LQPEYHYLLNIAVAVVLSLVVGLEREFNQKSAGLRTHTLVGLGAALFMVISKYGFTDISAETGYSLDGSRVAAQVASGVGFLGAGLIFVRRDTVRGLTTAASIWLVAAIGMAAGAGMFVIAPGVVIAYLLVVAGIAPLTRRLPHSKSSRRALMIRYVDGKGVLRHIIMTIAEHGLRVSDLEMRTDLFETVPARTPETWTRHQDIILKLTGSPRAVENSVVALNLVEGVERISVTDVEDPAA
jgi:putative Mg2+ transporter-C (MgtC) family protein